MKNKNPLTAGILNFMIWGSGYIYNGKKVSLGIGLLLGYVAVHLPVFYNGFSYYFFNLPGLFTLIGHTIISIVLAYDAYKEVES